MGAATRVTGEARMKADGLEAPQARRSGRLSLFGVGIDNLSLGELLEAVDERVASGEPGYIVTPNVDHLRLLSENEALREAYRGAWLRCADGTAVLWAARLMGLRFKEKLSGSDLIYDLSAHAVRKGQPVFILGAAPGVADRAAERLKSLYPGLEVKGTYSPPLGFERDEEESTAAVNLVRASGADFCFVALGSPKQEVWCSENATALGVPVVLCCGAAVDFAAGFRRRAPRWMQRLGMEWVWRMALEPNRLFRRYVLQDIPFLARALWLSLVLRRPGSVLPGMKEGEEI